MHSTPLFPLGNKLIKKQLEELFDLDKGEIDGPRCGVELVSADTRLFWSLPRDILNLVDEYVNPPTWCSIPCSVDTNLRKLEKSLLRERILKTHATE